MAIRAVDVVAVVEPVAPFIPAAARAGWATVDLPKSWEPTFPFSISLFLEDHDDWWGGVGATGAGATNTTMPSPMNHPPPMVPTPTAMLGGKFGKSLPATALVPSAAPPPAMMIGQGPTIGGKVLRQASQVVERSETVIKRHKAELIRHGFTCKIEGTDVGSFAAVEVIANGRPTSFQLKKRLGTLTKLTITRPEVDEEEEEEEEKDDDDDDDTIAFRSNTNNNNKPKKKKFRPKVVCAVILDGCSGTQYVFVPEPPPTTTLRMKLAKEGNKPDDEPKSRERKKRVISSTVGSKSTFSKMGGKNPPPSSFFPEPPTGFFDDGRQRRQSGVMLGNQQHLAGRRGSGIINANAGNTTTHLLGGVGVVLPGAVKTEYTGEWILVVDSVAKMAPPLEIPDPEDVSCARLESETQSGLQQLLSELWQWSSEKGLQPLHCEFNSLRTMAYVYFRLSLAPWAQRDMVYQQTLKNAKRISEEEEEEMDLINEGDENGNLDISSDFRDRLWSRQQRRLRIWWMQSGFFRPRRSPSGLLTNNNNNNNNNNAPQILGGIVVPGGLDFDIFGGSGSDGGPPSTLAAERDDDEIDWNNQSAAIAGVALYALERHLKMAIARRRLAVARSGIRAASILLCRTLVHRKLWLSKREYAKILTSACIRVQWRSEISALREAVSFLQARLRRKVIRSEKFRRAEILVKDLTPFIKRAGRWRWRERDLRARETLRKAVRSFAFIRRRFVAKRKMARLVQARIRANLARQAYLAIARPTMFQLAITLLQSCIRRRRIRSNLAPFLRVLRSRKPAPLRFRPAYLSARLGWTLCRDAIHCIGATAARMVARRSFVAESVLIRLGGVGTDEALKRRMLVQMMMMGAPRKMGIPVSMVDYCISLVRTAITLSAFMKRRYFAIRWKITFDSLGRLGAAVKQRAARIKFAARLKIKAAILASPCRRSYVAAARFLWKLELDSVRREKFLKIEQTIQQERVRREERMEKEFEEAKMKNQREAEEEEERRRVAQWDGSQAAAAIAAAHHLYHPHHHLNEVSLRSTSPLPSPGSPLTMGGRRATFDRLSPRSAASGGSSAAAPVLVAASAFNPPQQQQQQQQQQGGRDSSPDSARSMSLSPHVVPQQDPSSSLHHQHQQQLPSNSPLPGRQMDRDSLFDDNLSVGSGYSAPAALLHRHNSIKSVAAGVLKPVRRMRSQSLLVDSRSVGSTSSLLDLVGSSTPHSGRAMVNVNSRSLRPMGSRAGMTPNERGTWSEDEDEDEEGEDDEYSEREERDEQHHRQSSSSLNKGKQRGRRTRKHGKNDDDDYEDIIPLNVGVTLSEKEQRQMERLMQQQQQQHASIYEEDEENDTSAPHRQSKRSSNPNSNGVSRNSSMARNNNNNTNNNNENENNENKNSNNNTKSVWQISSFCGLKLQNLAGMALITAIAPNSPASLSPSPIQPGDRLIAIDGAKLPSPPPPSEALENIIDTALKENGGVGLAIENVSSGVRYFAILAAEIEAKKEEEEEEKNNINNNDEGEEEEIYVAAAAANENNHSNRGSGRHTPNSARSGNILLNNNNNNNNNNNSNIDYEGATYLPSLSSNSNPGSKKPSRNNSARLGPPETLPAI